MGLVLVVGIVPSMLDTTIVNVALHTMGDELGAGLSTVQWVVTGYLLALAVMIPVTGWAVDRFGGKWLFTAATGLFAAASALCAAAGGVGALIGFRVLQGAAGALLMPVAQTILVRAAGPGRMGRVMSVVGIPALLAPIFGPVLGGLIVDHLSWRWIFLVNLPIGVVSLGISLKYLPSDRPHGVRRPFDLRGWALLSPGLALLVYGLSRAGVTGSFANLEAWPVMAGGVLLVALFGWHASTQGQRALIPLAYFRDRAFAAASAVTPVISISVFGVLLLLPLYYQQVRHSDALHAGLLLAPQGLGTALAMPIAGRLADRLGARPVVAAGMTLTMLGTLALTQIGADTPYWLLAVALVVRGLGFGGSLMPAMAAGYRTLPVEAAGHASSVLQILSRVGGTIGGALMAVLLSQQIGDRAPTLATVVDAYDNTFWWATAVTTIGIGFALLLPGRAELDQPAASPAASSPVRDV